MAIRYFLGGLSPEGFHSFYPELIDLKKIKRVYIIKSGPGSGKSSFMRRVIQRVEEAYAENGGGPSGELGTEHIHCSSDPDSLDGVVFRTLGAAIIDGTPPHAVEPRYAGVVERYLPLCAFSDYTGLKQERERLCALTDQNKVCYGRAYRILHALRALRDDMFGLMVTDAALQKIERRTAGIIARCIRPSGAGARRGSRHTGAQGTVSKRFLNAFSPAGTLCFYETALTVCRQIYELEDHFGLAHLMLQPILRAAQNAGYDVTACYNPMSPGTELTHVLIPALSLGFVSSNVDAVFPGEAHSRVRLDACLSPELARQRHLRLRFLRKTERALQEEITAILQQAKAIHDEMEAIYNPCTDFEALYAEADVIAREILAL